MERWVMASLPSRLPKGGRNCENFIYSEEVSHWEPTYLSCFWPFLHSSLLPRNHEFCSFLCCTLLSPWHFAFTTSPTNRDKWWWIETSETSRTISPSLFSLQLIISDNLVTDIKNLLTQCSYNKKNIILPSPEVQSLYFVLALLKTSSKSHLSLKKNSWRLRACKIKQKAPAHASKIQWHQEQTG